jgi:urease accessory protein
MNLTTQVTHRATAFTSDATAAGWTAGLELHFERAPRRTELTRRKHIGPLRVQRPFYPEGDVAHVYVLHPPGGMVGGDRVDIAIRVLPDAAALLTTPAAQKLYRSSGAECRQTVELHVADGASLEWLPGETIAFTGARAAQTTRVDLAPTARFIGWELGCFGRPASALPFSSGHLSWSFEMYRADTPLVIERQRAGGGSATLVDASGYAGRPAWGALYATLGGVSPDELTGALRSALATGDGVRAGVTVVDDVLVVRVSAMSIESTRSTLTACWSLLRPALLGKRPVPPRIWTT